MIELKDLINRRYEGNKCIAFEFSLRGEEAIVKFERRASDEKEFFWLLRIINQSSNFKNAEVYEIPFNVPKQNLSLQMICAIGLKYYQYLLKDEVQNKSDLDFKISDLIKGMYE